MVEENKPKKKGLFQRVKLSMIVSVIFFALNGVIFPMLLEAPLTIMSFLSSGLVSVALMWISIIVGRFVIQI